MVYEMNLADQVAANIKAAGVVPAQPIRHQQGEKDLSRFGYWFNLGLRQMRSASLHPVGMMRFADLGGRVGRDAGNSVAPACVIQPPSASHRTMGTLRCGDIRE